jgi:hypothetical protein
MTLTREQTQKAIEELKANEWVALGGMSPEAQEFTRENANKSIWEYPIGDGKKCVGVIEAVSFGLYRLDPSYTLPEIEPEYLELDINADGISFWDLAGEEYAFDVATPPRKIRCNTYQLEGYKFEDSNVIRNYYHGWEDSAADILCEKFHTDDKKVFALKVVYRKVG